MLHEKRKDVEFNEFNVSADHFIPERKIRNITFAPSSKTICKPYKLRQRQVAVKSAAQSFGTDETI
jgi:hypothetical protein